MLPFLDNHCLGAALARMETQEVVRAVTSRWSGATVGAGTRIETALTGQVARLPVEFRPLDRAT